MVSKIQTDSHQVFKVHGFWRSLATSKLQALSVIPLVSSATDYGGFAAKPPIIHGARESVALRPTSPAWIGCLDPVRSIFIALLFPAQTHWTVPREQVQENILIWSHTVHASAFQSAISVYCCIQNFQWFHRPCPH